MAQLEHIEAIERRLWSAADTLWANSNFAANEFFTPVSLVSFIARVVERQNQNSTEKLTFFGMEKNDANFKELMG